MPDQLGTKRIPAGCWNVKGVMAVCIGKGCGALHVRAVQQDHEHAGQRCAILLGDNA